jgi:drug/metabolite transporter (DMT)-like permease
MTLSGIIAGFLANYLYFHVVQKHSSYVVSALIFSSPFFTFLLSYFFLKEDMTWLSGLGAFFIITGIVLLGVSGTKPISNSANLVRAD